MKKMHLVTLLALAICSNTASSYAASPSSSDNRFAKAGKAVEHGVMWGPKKVGHGMKVMGEKTKKVFHKGK